MAGVKISQLPLVITAQTTDLFPVVQGGVTSGETLSQVQILFGFSSGILGLAAGGTAAALTANVGGIVYSGASALAILAGTATANRVLLSGSSAAPAWSTATYPGTTTINQILYSSSANTIAGLATANSATLYTNASGVPSMSASMTNGQLLIGSTGASPAVATLTAGTGVFISNGAGTITIGVTGSGNWVDQTSSTVTMGANTGYTIDNGASLVTLTLPTSANLGDFVEINGFSSGGWKIAQAAGQQIYFGNQTTTAGTGGSLASTNLHDCIRLRCVVAGGTTWTVVASIGNITVV